MCKPLNEFNSFVPICESVKRVYQIGRAEQIGL